MSKDVVKNQGRGFPGGKKKIDKNTLFRLLKFMFSNFKLEFFVLAICVILNAVSVLTASIFLRIIIDDCIRPVLLNTVEMSDGMAKLTSVAITMGCMYVVGLLANFLQSQLLVTISQNLMLKMRKKMFSGMQKLPIRYFDTHTHGDIMSHYTNDIDTLYQLVAQSIPAVFSAGIMIVALFFVMISYSIWLTVVVFAVVILMAFVAKKVGGRSSRYFIKQQTAVGKNEGYIEEMMHGQKVIKVFCHERESERGFDEINEELCRVSTEANIAANTLGPIIGNIGNILYVLLAFVGGVLLTVGAPNLTILGIGEFTTGVIVSFLPMSRVFTNNFNNASQQAAFIAMGLAGANRIFTLADEEPEQDEGYVTLVNANIAEDGTITESETRTGKWAWKHPHSADGSVTYTELKGDIRMFDVDFGYVPEKIVLHGVTLYATPGQKVAFVGATGAGKTTITNLINRFYDIADGKIRYDGININKIKKSDLRRSLGIVLQDTNLFTGTVMDNIRYGKLDATDEECIEAAKLANAHDFITRLPEGYRTMLTGDGANLSQGQRQLLSIARAAVCNAPVMILDEATSSIDTRTEAIVQSGMDNLMHGRTVFVIAHRLSTVQNSDVIMVLEHGVVIERGSHKDLIEKKGKYYQLYTGAFELE